MPRTVAISAASCGQSQSRKKLIADGATYPGLRPEKGHKGYPTKAHIEAIQQLGVLPQHRRSFKPVQQALEQSS